LTEDIVEVFFRFGAFVFSQTQPKFFC